MWTMLRPRRVLPATLLAVGVLMTTPACAMQTYGYGNRGGYSRDIERRAYDIGYREGLDRGQNDARRGRDYSYSRHDEYRDADDGYERAYGDRNFYRRTYRQGFEQGYSDGYRRYARGNGNNYPRQGYPNYPNYPNYPSYPNGPGTAVPRYGYGSPASEVGYRDGYDAGRHDARDRNRFDPIRSSRYRSGDHDYDSRYGSRDEYKREYRAAFQQGYDQGYRENRR